MKFKTSFKKQYFIIFALIFTLIFCACSKNNDLNTSSSDQINFESSKNIVSEIPDSTVYSDNTESSDLKENIPIEWQDNGIFSQYYDKAYIYMKEMTVDEKIGQMIFARCPSQNAVETAKDYHLGGYVLFGRDFEGKTGEQVISNISLYKNSSKIPMSIATDEEGGTVVRISSKEQLYDHEFKSPRDIYADGGMEAIRSEEEKKAVLLSSLLIDVNFAPVCDISQNESDFMYERSLGEDPVTTAEFVRTVTQISQSKGVSVTLKHFPGYGSNLDTHTGIAVDDRNYNDFVDNDFIPFKAGIESGAHLIMVSHNIVNCMDNEKPASISENVHNIIRNELGFTGIIITDDLDMGAIKQYSGKYSPVVSAILAGNDMLITGDVISSFNDIKQALSDGIIEQSLIDHAVMRIIAWKLQIHKGDFIGNIGSGFYKVKSI